MKNYGLIGYPLGHSFSKKYFTEKFAKQRITDAVYELYPIESLDELRPLLHKVGGLCGLNVTIPYKEQVMKHLDWIEHDAKTAGAVNCIKVYSESPVSAAFSGEVGINGHDFRLEGYNTDIHGFNGSLTPLLTSAHEKALILGDGGAAKAVKCVLDNKSISYKTVTRKPVEGNILFSDVTDDMVAEYKLIINTTPIGTYPNVDEAPPIPYDAVGSKHLLFDLVYNPPVTKFLQNGMDRNAATKNGYEMLVLQAEKAWEIWTNED
ncbi:shikimate dehydrogenase [Mucilaginibacter pallidiroseus]|uniref:Shikimate dehydrogenase n=1 Tax=Mucilaginibacter pallidiroseus TaxID=2599295 RepID=A0A563UH51_9SPHI|nr:shikimate dehydrogenase [Mucilaginibacter pallidiroseus]TWR30636.1 shikimate dehydrogenase [Mucilaginibacter pallidiroseus]